MSLGTTLIILIVVVIVLIAGYEIIAGTKGYDDE